MVAMKDWGFFLPMASAILTVSSRYSPFVSVTNSGTFTAFQTSVRVACGLSIVVIETQYRAPSNLTCRHHSPAGEPGLALMRAISAKRYRRSSLARVFTHSTASGAPQKSVSFRSSQPFWK